MPRLAGIAGHAGTARTEDDRALGVRWRLGDGAVLTLIANLHDDPCAAPMAPTGRVLYESAPGLAKGAASAPLPGWSVAAVLDESAADGSAP